MAPVFSLVLDTDVNEDLALLYPELYKELTKVRTRHVNSADRAGPLTELPDILHMAHHLGLSG